MKKLFYPKLAWDGIRKNKKLYLPYFLTCVGMILIFYVIHYLAAMPTLKEMPGGRTTERALGMGVWIIALFSLFFLFYTNSFLMRRRRKELGLYNVLGMGKWSLCRLLFWENLILFGASMLAGLTAGVLLSKMTELCLVAIIRGTVSYDLSVNMDALVDTAMIFAPIFGLIFLKGVFQLSRYSAISLLKSENVGEKPPRARYLPGIAGAAILIGAYALALSIDSPLSAMGWFFVAVGMVVVATYLLFISGSVLLCRLLQKNPAYYYRKKRFVSVAFMAYRMKRNGAGLASICVLNTMVLVMMMCVGSLYFGKEESIRRCYPHEFSVSVEYVEGEDGYTDEKATRIYDFLDALLAEWNVPVSYTEKYLSAQYTGILRQGKLSIDPETVETADSWTMNDAVRLYLLSLDSYNQCMGTSETLTEDEVLLYCADREYGELTVELFDGTVWRVQKRAENMMEFGGAARNALPTVVFVVSDIESAVDALNAELVEYPPDNRCRLRQTFCFDTGLSASEQLELFDDLYERLRELDMSGESGFYCYYTESQEAERSDSYGIFGGVFFLGLLLSATFLAAAVLIMYYKQISEGYEDEARFEIMQKVGMTSRDVRESVDAQMRLVFFPPLALAGLHMLFAWPFISKIIYLLAALELGPLSVLFNVLWFVGFGIFYGIAYRVTSRAYCAVVGGR